MLHVPRLLSFFEQLTQLPSLMLIILLPLHFPRLLQPLLLDALIQLLRSEQVHVLIPGSSSRGSQELLLHALLIRPHLLLLLPLSVLEELLI